jgi:4-hydroxy-tetrahydrodipicolinate synthase
LERGGKFLQCVKFACELQGLPGGAVRLPQRPMTKERRRQMTDVMLTAQKTVRAIVAESAARAAPKGPRPVSVDEAPAPTPKRASARASSD